MNTEAITNILDLISFFLAAPGIIGRDRIVNAVQALRIRPSALAKFVRVEAVRSMPKTALLLSLFNALLAAAYFHKTGFVYTDALGWCMKLLVWYLSIIGTYTSIYTLVERNFERSTLDDIMLVIATPFFVAARIIAIMSAI